MHGMTGCVMCEHVQDEHGGGISDRPEDMVDVYHTFFGLAGLSLMGRCGLEPIDPVYALPAATVQHLRPPAEGADGMPQQRGAEQKPSEAAVS